MWKHDFDKLKKGLRPESLEKAGAKAREMMAEMLLAEIRKEAGFTQDDIAKALGIRQPSLSKLESQDDMQISTLQRLIQALGGQLELIAHMPGGDIQIRQFKTRQRVDD
jgi:transcriptional regulator with XRE-family HTH domain